MNSILMGQPHYTKQLSFFQKHILLCYAFNGYNSIPTAFSYPPVLVWFGEKCEDWINFITTGSRSK